jgi:hypothetical protein
MVDTILSSTGLLLQSGSDHNDGDDLISITTTVQRTLSSTVPGLASEYSVTSTDGELILLF